MPGSSRSVPQAAYLDEYDSDQSSVRPHTRVHARKQSTSRPAPRVVQVQRREAASDSGYSSHNSAANGSTAQVQTIRTVVAPTVTRQAAPASPSQSRPTTQRRDSQVTQPRASSRPAPVSRQSAQCTDPNCGNPNCQSARNAERRYTWQQGITREQYDAMMAQRQRQAASQQYYAQYPQGSTPAPVPTTQAPARTISARPASMYGAYPGVTQQHGPPPSPSAYHQNYLADYYQNRQSAVYGTTPPSQGIATYSPQSPIMASPTSPSFPIGTGLQRTLSARQVDPTIASYDLSKSYTQPPLNRTYSARRTTAVRPIPGAFPEPELAVSDSESSSDSHYSEDERERERERESQRRARARDSKLMPPPSSRPPSRRPSLSTRYTAPVVHTGPSREPLRRAPRSDHDVEYPSSSDNFDSDRTARAVVDRPRTNSSFSSRSRRPSISTTASSGRTKATTISSGSGLERGMERMVMEDRHGRRRSYLSKRELEDLARRRQQKAEDQEIEASIEAYQQAVRGTQPPELTAENIRKSQHRRSGSQHSRKSSHSSKMSKSEGIKIQSGRTVLHVYGEANIEMRPGEDGPHLVIGSASGRDSGYHGSSKGSSSRVGRRKETIREEDV